MSEESNEAGLWAWLGAILTLGVGLAVVAIINAVNESERRDREAPIADAEKVMRIERGRAWGGI